MLLSQAVEMGVESDSVCSIGVVDFSKIVEALVVLLDVLVARLPSLLARHLLIQEQLLDFAETGPV